MKGRKTMNKTHSKYEDACGLDDVVVLLSPHLKGKAVIDGNPFPCPLEMHPKGDRRMMRLERGRNWTKGRWRCGAGCHGEKAEDTLTYIRLKLQMTHAEAVTLWAELAHSPREEWSRVVEEHRPNYFKRIGEARFIEEPVTDAEAEELQEKHRADGEATYFADPKVGKALRSAKETLTAAGELTENQARALLEALKQSLEGNNAA